MTERTPEEIEAAAEKLFDLFPPVPDQGWCYISDRTREFYIARAARILAAADASRPKDPHDQRIRELEALVRRERAESRNRIADLLEANNRYLERARTAERVLAASEPNPWVESFRESR